MHCSPSGPPFSFLRISAATSLTGFLSESPALSNTSQLEDVNQNIDLTGKFRKNLEQHMEESQKNQKNNTPRSCRRAAAFTIVLVCRPDPMPCRVHTRTHTHTHTHILTHVYTHTTCSQIQGTQNTHSPTSHPQILVYTREWVEDESISPLPPPKMLVFDEI